MLREAKEEMKVQLEVERKWLDGYLMQQTAACSSDANYRKEVELQIQNLKAEAQKKSEEMKSLQNVLEEKDMKMKRLTQLVTDQESQLQQMNAPLRMLTMDEHQLQRYLDILGGILDLKKQVSDAEDECHITSTKVKILQEEADQTQRHSTALVQTPVNESISEAGLSSECISIGQWKTKATKGDETCVEVGSLRSATPYCFPVRTECESGVSEFSKLRTAISTCKSEWLAEVMKAISQQLPNKNGPPTYKVCGEEINYPGKMLRKVAIGEARPGVPEKALMILGASGAGKTTLINAMINYIFGVKWEDNFRFKLIAEVAKCQTNSKTSAITAYTIHHMDGSEVDYSLTIIDTPGFRDTSGLERNSDIIRQIKELFTLTGQKGISHLNGIRIVSQSALARLMPTQQYVLDSILSILGKDIAQNIFIMVTFSDGQRPPVMSAIEEAHIPHKGYFKFNNSALFAETCVEDDEDNFDELLWRMGISSFKRFFTAFQMAEGVSLTMTQDVLSLQQHLETIVVGYQVQMRECLAKMEELCQERIILKAHEKDMSVYKDFSYESTVPYYRREQLEQRVETRIADDLKAKFETAKHAKTTVAEKLAGHQCQLEEAHVQMNKMVKEFQTFQERLDEITLKPNPFTQVEYIELLITFERQQAKEGWMERVRCFEATKQQAMLLAVMKDANDADK